MDAAKYRKYQPMKSLHLHIYEKKSQVASEFIDK